MNWSAGAHSLTPLKNRIPAPLNHIADRGWPVSVWMQGGNRGVHDTYVTASLSPAAKGVSSGPCHVFQCPPPPTHPLPSVPRTLIMQHAPTGCQTQESYEAASASLALRSWDLLGSRPGRPNILFEVNQPPNQPKTEVSWVGFWGFPGLAKAHPRRCCSQPLPARGAR